MAKLIETCPCGAEFEVEDESSSPAYVERAANAWRREHLHIDTTTMTQREAPA